ncbi:MAG: patatin family protein [Candidatus Delongbacteria bacterium]
MPAWPPESTTCGLVLEGGGLRGVYTSGVLRALHDLGLTFPAVIGTSMGACNGVNWVAGQQERNRIVNTRFVRDTRWFSWARLLRSGEAFGMDFIYGDVPLRLVPFDFAAFRANPAGWTTSATDVDTGAAVYVDKPGLSDAELMTVLRAATSLPWIGNPVEFRGRRLMDGGLVDSVPLARSEADGLSRNLVVLTQCAGYRKQPATTGWALRRRHPGCPGLWGALARRHEQYNASLELVEQRRAAGSAFVLRPGSTLGIGRVTRDPQRLLQLYDLGYHETLARAAELREWLVM